MRRGQETLNAIDQNDDTLTKLLICGLKHRQRKYDEEMGEFDPTTLSIASDAIILAR